MEPSGPKGRRRKGPGRTDDLLCVKVGDALKPMPVAMLEAKKEAEDPLKGPQRPAWSRSIPMHHREGEFAASQRGIPAWLSSSDDA